MPIYNIVLTKTNILLDKNNEKFNLIEIKS